MPDVINLTCPKCGGKLQITNDIDRFSCGYCGNELIVRRSGGAITIAPVVEELKRVEAGVDKTASELAIVRLEGEINNLAAKLDNGGIGNCSGLIIFVMLIFLLGGGILLVLSNGTDNSAALTMLGIGTVLFVIVVVMIGNANKNAQIKNGPINLAIAEKRKELEKHRNIVRNG